MPRYLFIAPTLKRVAGGQNVLMRVSDILHRAGYDIGVVHAYAHSNYPFSKSLAKNYFYRPLAKIERRLLARKALLRSAVPKAFEAWGSPVRNEMLTLREDDVIVIPEFRFSEYAAPFEGHRLILFSQDVYGLCNALLRDEGFGLNRIKLFERALCTSEASQNATEEFTRLTTHRIQLSLGGPSAPAAAPKKKQIAFMPRKRAQEVEIITKWLRRSREFDDWKLAPIDGITENERNQVIGESLIFLSFSHQEGFGLPPAEAMAAECIVVGYTGVGGAEYFSNETGVLVLDSDLVGFVQALRSVITAYEANPEPWDVFRRAAAASILSRYSDDKMINSVLQAWTIIDSD